MLAKAHFQKAAVMNSSSRKAGYKGLSVSLEEKLSVSASPPLAHRHESGYFHMHKTRPLIFHGTFVAFLFRHNKIPT